MITLSSGIRERSSLHTVTPSPSGSRTSRTATSGRRAGTRASASAAFLASPTTRMVPPLSSTPATPRRTTSWSSRRNTEISAAEPSAPTEPPSEVLAATCRCRIARLGRPPGSALGAESPVPVRTDDVLPSPAGCPFPCSDRDRGGSTEGVARRIAEVLDRSGAAVVCRPASRDLDPIRPGAVGVVLQRLGAEPARPVPAHPLVGRGRAATDRATLPVGVAPARPPALSRRDPRGGASRCGDGFYLLTGGRAGDQRDWPAVEAWTAAIATELPA